jgi:hypothetical protein
MSKSRKKTTPKRVLALPDLEQAKSAVLNTLTSVSGQRTYDHAINDFVEWYCSEPRLAFPRCAPTRCAEILGRIPAGRWGLPEDCRAPWVSWPRPLPIM